MTTIEQLYWIFAVPSTLIFTVFMILTFVGGDVDTDADMDGDIDADEGIPFQFITIKNLVGFFTVFSWTGLAFIHGGYSTTSIIVASSIAGFTMMLIMTTIFYLMSKLTESGNLNINKAVGSIGETYLTIKANRKEFGKVQIKITGSLQTLDALTDEDEDIKTGSIVEVIEVFNNNILVVKSSSK